MRPAFFSTVKCPDSVDLARGKRSAISPAVRSRLRSIFKMARRVGSARAVKTSVANYISVVAEIYVDADRCQIRAWKARQDTSSGLAHAERAPTSSASLDTRDD